MHTAKTEQTELMWLGEKILRMTCILSPMHCLLHKFAHVHEHLHMLPVYYLLSRQYTIKILNIGTCMSEQTV